jgi:hypothetical protein
VAVKACTKEILMVEAKLTETDFQTAPARMIERYRDMGEVFHPPNLMLFGDVIPNYQLTRGVCSLPMRTADRFAFSVMQGARI